MNAFLAHVPKIEILLTNAVMENMDIKLVISLSGCCEMSFDETSHLNHQGII